MIIKCKMCGGDILFTPGDTYGTCDSCGSVSTIPQADDESKLNRYNRANHFRRQCEFDKAVSAYEKILEQDDTDAEAHWGAVLSRFGIEYVEDPATKKRVPTCHRAQVKSILTDEDYLAAVQYAPDNASRELYKQQAAEIAEIQKGILAISANEKPYDVFICYKETDEHNQRTRDSQWAQDVYYGLTEQGYKAFFSRITLEDKLGQQYEPYIFAALNSARVMVVIGSKPEYFNAVWVKNEWSRYLALMAKDRKRMLIPCYRDMDPYDLPEELSSLQSQDMGKIGFMQDLLRGVKKVLDADKKQEQPKVVQQTVQVSSSGAGTPGVKSLIDRTYLFMEDGDFQSAGEYLNRVLDIDPKYAPAYAAKVCVALGIRKEAGLADSTFLYEDDADWQKALRFATPEQKKVYEGYIAKVRERVKLQIRNWAYDCAMEMAVNNPKVNRQSLEAELATYKAMCNRSTGDRANGGRRTGYDSNERSFKAAAAANEPGNATESGLKEAALMFDAIGDEQAKECAKQCRTLAEQARQKAIYLDATAKMNSGKDSAIELDAAGQRFLSIPEYKDAKSKALKCQKDAETIRERLYRSVSDQIAKAGNSTTAWAQIAKEIAHVDLKGYKDIRELQEKAEEERKRCAAADEEAARLAAEQKAEAEKRAKRNKTFAIIAACVACTLVIVFFTVIQPEMKRNSAYQAAADLQQEGKYEEAISAFGELGEYKDASTQITETKYQQAKALKDQKDYAGAAAIFITIKGYKDVDNLLSQDDNLAAAAAHAAAIAPFQKVGNYVSFGHYEQDNNTSNGQEEIEWQVLAVNGNQVLLISRYGLDAKPYNTEYTSVTWETCTLRTWLNNDFLNKAFTAEEQNAIATTDVDNSQSQCYSGWSTKGGNNTQDKIFLLSYAEANKYFNVEYYKVDGAEDNMKSRVEPTAYAIAQGAYTSRSYKTQDGAASGWWWLRSPGDYPHGAARVGLDGSLNYNIVNYDSAVVRPAFCLNLESGIF